MYTHYKTADSNVPFCSTATSSTKEVATAQITPESTTISTLNLARRTVKIAPPFCDTYPPSFGQQTISAASPTGDRCMPNRSGLQVEAIHPPFYDLSSVTDDPQSLEKTKSTAPSKQPSPGRDQQAFPANLEYSSSLIFQEIQLGNRVLGLTMAHPTRNQLEPLFAFHWHTQSALIIVTTPQSQLDNPQYKLSAYFQKQEVYGSCAAACHTKLGFQQSLDSGSFAEQYQLMLVNSAQPGGIISKALHVIHVQTSTGLNPSTIKQLATLINVSVPKHFVSLPITFYEPFPSSHALVLLGFLEAAKTQEIHPQKINQNQNQIQKIVSLDSGNLRQEFSVLQNIFPSNQ